MAPPTTVSNVTYQVNCKTSMPSTLAPASRTFTDRSWERSASNSLFSLKMLPAIKSDCVYVCVYAFDGCLSHRRRQVLHQRALSCLTSPRAKPFVQIAPACNSDSEPLSRPSSHSRNLSYKTSVQCTSRQGGLETWQMSSLCSWCHRCAMGASEPLCFAH